MGLKDLLGQYFFDTDAAASFQPGLHHAKRLLSGGSADLHLRIENDLSGVLLVNASRMYYLNPSAAFLAFYLLNELPEAVLLKRFRQRFGLSGAQASADLATFKTDYDRMTDPDSFCPLCDLDLDVSLPHTHTPSAPYRMDLALTYRCNNNCLHCYNDRSRPMPELSTAEWKQVLDRTWQTGIPHIIFTGGEPTLLEKLPELIAYAQNLGQLTGLNTNGRRLADPAYVERLVSAGLDHVQITLESHHRDIHDAMVASPHAWDQTVEGIRNALASRLYVMTNTTLLTPNAGQLADFLDFAAGLGVPTIGLNALIYSGAGLETDSGLREDMLPDLLSIAKAKADQHGFRLIWYTPTQYCHFDPIAMDLGIKGCSAARYNMCVEPNGDVLPCQSYYVPLGNILRDPWDAIWNHDIATSLRDRRDVPFACQTCEVLNECGGGCPLARQAGKMSTPIPVQSGLPVEVS